MKFLRNKNTIALWFISLITFTFFIAGLLDILDHILIQAFLFFGFAAVLAYAIWCGFKNEPQKNRPKDKLQDDSN